MRNPFFFSALLLSLTACPTLAPGEPCEVSGDSFQRRDPCEDVCVEWEVDCVGGTAVTPGVCSGSTCSTDADCSPGFGCALTNYTDRHCLPDSLCPDGFADTYQGRPPFDLNTSPSPTVPKLPSAASE